MNLKGLLTIWFVSILIFGNCNKDENSNSNSACLKGPYLGQEPPGFTPKIFAHDLISAPSCGEYACAFSPDGKEFYFTRTAATSQTIMVCRELADGWTKPQAVMFSSGYSAHEPHLTFDNKTIYFGWFRPVPVGEVSYNRDHGIWASDRTETGWSAARYVGQGMYVTSGQDGQLFLTDLTEQNTAYLAKTSVFNGRFSPYERLVGGMENIRTSLGGIAHPCIAPDGSYIVFDFWGSHLFVCFKQVNGTWGAAFDLALQGIPAAGGIASISPDGKFLFYEYNGHIYWVSTDIIKNLL